MLPNPNGRSAALETHTPTTQPLTTQSPTPHRESRKPRLLHMLVMGVAVPGIFCTVALPAYAMTGTDGTDGAAATAALQEFKEQGAQTVSVDETAVQAADRDAYTAVSAAEMYAAQRAAELAAQRAAAAAAMASGARSGPSVSSLLANPPYPGFSLDTIVNVALQYQGVPYRYGGADPSGFDCSGFTQFVYAHVGISLPHSSSAQGRYTRIAPEAALPGDLVILDGGGHVGIYLGGNQMIDAPYAGKTVQVRAIYSSNHYFVRVGI